MLASALLMRRSWQELLDGSASGFQSRILGRALLAWVLCLRLSPGPCLCRPPAVQHGRNPRTPLQTSQGREAIAEPFLKLPRHRTNTEVNKILERAESLVKDIVTGELDPALRPLSSRGLLRTRGKIIGLEDRVYANSYVNLDHAEVVGFDYDYTLVSYKPALLFMIYDKAKEVLVDKFSYPAELLQDLAGYDPSFAIRGLAVDLETAWVCKLTYRYRVSTAFYGRERLSKQVVLQAYRSATGYGILSQEERRARLRPLNDLFSLVEACLLADVVQWFKDRNIPFEPGSVVTDVLSSVGKTHTSGAMHKAVVDNLDKFIEPDARRHMRHLLEQLKASGKKLMLVSNSEFWYVDAGMKYVTGDDWRSLFDVVVASAGKPGFYTTKRIFREVSARTGRVKFKPVTSLEPGEVYCYGSIGELMRLTNWTKSGETDPTGSGWSSWDGSKIMYFGDSLFADLVDARRLYGWTTGAIIREVRDELHVQNHCGWRQARHTMQVLVHCAQLCQEEMGPDPCTCISNRQHRHTTDDIELLDALEVLITKWRHQQDRFMNSNFGSIFRTTPCEGVRSSPSLFAFCLQRHVDLYTSRVENLRLYSTDHRFYPAESRVGIPHEAMHTTDSILDLVCEGQQTPEWEEAED